LRQTVSGNEQIQIKEWPAIDSPEEPCRNVCSLKQNKILTGSSEESGKMQEFTKQLLLSGPVAHGEAFQFPQHVLRQPLSHRRAVEQKEKDELKMVALNEHKEFVPLYATRSQPLHRGIGGFFE
jgi:hypothetical protein